MNCFRNNRGYTNMGDFKRIYNAKDNMLFLQKINGILT